MFVAFPFILAMLSMTGAWRETVSEVKADQARAALLNVENDDVLR